MVASPAGIFAPRHFERPTSDIFKKGMSDTTNPARSSPAAASGEGVGLHSVLEAEASRRRAAEGAAARSSAAASASMAAAGFHSGLGGAHGRPSASSLLAGMPPSLRASRSLDFDFAASIPPGLRPSQSLSMDPPSLRAAQSVGLGPPSLARGSSLTAYDRSCLTSGTSLARGPTSLTRGASFTAGPPSLSRGTSLGGATSLELAAAHRAAALGVTYPNIYGDPRRRMLLAQQAAASGVFSSGFPGGFPGIFPGGPYGSNLYGSGPSSIAGPWRNMPNVGVSGQGLELLRAASLSVPNRMGSMAGLSFPTATAVAAAAAGPPAGPGTGAAAAAAKAPVLSPEGTDSRKRKAADDDDSSDEEGNADKVFIPAIRDLDILCGRGGKSNHHFG
jgi:hypothetical protein